MVVRGLGKEAHVTQPSPIVTLLWAELADIVIPKIIEEFMTHFRIISNDVVVVFSVVNKVVVPEVVCIRTIR